MNGRTNMTYIYFLKYPIYEQELCQLEMKRIFDVDIQGFELFHDLDLAVSRSVFVKYKMEIYHQASDFETLLKEVRKENYVFEDFKLQFVKPHHHVVEYQDSLQKLRDLCEYIEGSVDMHHPKLMLGLTYIDGIWYFGKVEQDNQSWLSHASKPYSYSLSLSARDARVICSIAQGNRKNIQLIDPCCGVGTVILEGLSMGFHIIGSELNKDVCYKAKKNLIHFGYDPKVIEWKDMHTIDKQYDVAILDIPYGVYTPITKAQQQALICSTANFCKELILVALEDMSGMLEKAGYTIVAEAHVAKMQFKRYIYIARKDEE